LGAIGGPGMDAEMAKMMQKILQKQGMKFKLQTKVLGGELQGENVALEVEGVKNSKKETVSFIVEFPEHYKCLTIVKLEADVVLVAIGRRPHTAGLGLENVGIETDDKGRIIIDQEFRTKVPSIRVIGDVTFGAMLAHKVDLIQ